MSRSNVEPSEHHLIERAAAGGREAQRELFERYREAAYRVARRVTGRHADALDVVQDSFIKAFERLEGFQRDASFKTWFLRIVTNRALDLRRSRKVRIAVSLDREDDTSPEPDAGATLEGTPRGVLDTAGLEQQESTQRIEQAMETLPPDQRAVLALYASGDMTYGQIADVLGVPVGTVMSRLYHARKKMRAALGDLAPSDARGQT